MSGLSYSKEVIRDLVEGKLPWEQVKLIVSSYKDDDRFDKYIEISQEKVPWTEKILLPLTDDLYIVRNEMGRIVKCSCGYEFGDYRENWKLRSLIHVRDAPEEIDELFPYPCKPDPAYCEIREHYCPGCGAQLEVDVVPFGYPAVFDCLPDLDVFYREWLGSPLPEQMEFRDLTYEVIRKWSEESQST